MHRWGLLILLAAAGAPAAQDTEDASEAIERGRLQLEVAEYEEAQASYLEGISRLTAELGEFSPALIEPYSELARIYILNDQPLEAITVLEQARLVAQRNYGLFGLEQIALLDELGSALLFMGDTVEAQNLQRERMNVAVRRFGEDDPRTIPFRNHLANYYDQSRMRLRARDEYETILDIQRDAFGDDDGRLLIPLSRMAAIDILLGDSSSARRRIQQILESSTNATPVQRANALAVLGDWELVRGRTEAAHDYYRQAFESLRPEELSAAGDVFGTPRLINFVPPPSPVDLRGDRGPYAWGFIELLFSVSADGQAAGIVVTETIPVDYLERRYARQLAEARFRPRLVDGEPVATEAVSYSHGFRYFLQE